MSTEKEKLKKWYYIIPSQAIVGKTPKTTIIKITEKVSVLVNDDYISLNDNDINSVVAVIVEKFIYTVSTPEGQTPQQISGLDLIKGIEEGKIFEKSPSKFNAYEELVKKLKTANYQKLNTKKVIL